MGGKPFHRTGCVYNDEIKRQLAIRTVDQLHYSLYIFMHEILDINYPNK